MRILKTLVIFLVFMTLSISLLAQRQVRITPDGINNGGNQAPNSSEIEFVEGTFLAEIDLDASGNLDFGTGSTADDMTIDVSGRVGIGTSSPDESLDVNGDIALTDGTGRIVFKEGSLEKAFLSYSGTNLTLENNETSGSLTLDAVNDIFLQAGSTTRMFIRDDGNIGIGTTTPDQELDVNGDIALTDGTGLIEFKEGATQKAFLSYSGTNLTLENNETGGDIFIDAVDNMFLQAGSQTVLTVDSDQRVGIGDASPDFTLDISHALGVPSGSTGNGLSLRNTGSNNEDWRLYTDNGTGRLAFYENGNLASAILESGSYSNISDRRLKTDITYLDNSELERIMQLKPASYKFKKLAKSDRRNYGLIAQELQEVYPDLVSTSSDPGDEKQYLGVSYSELIPILIAGIQEQQAQIEAKDEQIDDLEARVAKLEQLILQSTNQQKVELNTVPSTSYLKQNQPNPFSSSTTIEYNVPETAIQAEIIITDLNGTILKKVVVEGIGQLKIAANSLAAGTYTYSLIIDGQVAASNKMLLTK